MVNVFNEDTIMRSIRKILGLLQVLQMNILFQKNIIMITMK